MNRKTTGLLLALLLIILGLVFWNKGAHQRAEDAQGARTGWSRDDASRPGSAPSKLPRDTGKRTTASDATHSPEELKNFILPAFETRDATLEEALATLFSQYDQICRDTGESPLRFTYRLEARPPDLLHLHLRQRSFLHVLRAIAAQAGLALDRRGTHLVFSEIVATPADELATASHPVPPGFRSELNALVSPAPPLPPGEDPVGGKNPAAAPPDTLAEDLRRLGIIRSSNATVTHLAANSTLLLRGSPADLARLQTYLHEEYLDKPPVSVRTSTKVIDSPEPLVFEGRRFSEPEFQELMRRLAQTAEVQLNTQPAVLSRPGQSGTVEVVREVILPQAVEADGNMTFQTDWTGFRMQIDSGQYGFDLQSHIRHESREMIGASPDSIEAQVASSTDVLPAGQTVLIETTSPTGAHRYLFVTSQRVDATGRPFDPRGEDR